jgi:proline dehydrogenase
VEQGDRLALFLGTHNLDSSMLLAELLSSTTRKPKFQAAFAQLLGMCDFLTFNLAKYGFKSYKYIPYGPIREAIPYLIRRAEENTAMESQVPFERQLVEQELKQRKGN